MYNLEIYGWILDKGCRQKLSVVIAGNTALVEVTCDINKTQSQFVLITEHMVVSQLGYLTATFSIIIQGTSHISIHFR
jgi:hypothetical protein